MARELQEYRKQYHQGQNHENFDDDAFYGWSRRYMEILGIDKNAVSYEDFRRALLQDGPLDEETSNQFWDILTSSTSPQEIDFSSVTDNVPAVAQRYGIDVSNNKDDLWNLAALRPLLDEYYPIEERKEFLTKYGDILLEGVPLEHLEITNDPSADAMSTTATKGSGVPVLSLPSPWSSKLPATARIHLRTMAYRTTVDDDLYALWKEHKAGRARYEEALFRTKRLGLAYGQPFDEGDDDDDDV
jgi:hypothetical protein